MQVVLSQTPSIVTRALVVGMSNAVCATFSCLFASVSKDDSLINVERRLSSLHVRTDMELLGAILSDMSASRVEQMKSTKVCLEHLHDSLSVLNASLQSMDDCVRRSRSHGWYDWSLGRGGVREREEALSRALTLVEEEKARLDHHMRRFMEVQSVRFE